MNNDAMTTATTCATRPTQKINLTRASWKKKLSNTKFHRTNAAFETENTQIKVTTLITVVLHEQWHHDYSDNSCNQANHKLTLQEHLSKKKCSKFKEQIQHSRLKTPKLK